MLTREDLVEIKNMFNNSCMDLVNNDNLVTAISNKIMEKMGTLIKNTETILMEEMKALKKENEALKEQLDDLEQHSRCNNVRIHGVEEESNENVELKVLDLFKNKMNLNISPELIQSCHRVGRQDNLQGSKKSRCIIVRMVSIRQQMEIMNNRKKLKGTNVFITEDLVRSRLRVFKMAQKKFGNKNVWTIRGKIMVKKLNLKHMVKSATDVDKL